MSNYNSLFSLIEQPLLRAVRTDWGAERCGHARGVNGPLDWCS